MFEDSLPGVKMLTWVEKANVTQEVGNHLIPRQPSFYYSTIHSVGSIKVIWHGVPSPIHPLV